MAGLKYKTVLITGASSGIGAACAKHFAKKGTKLILCARQIDKLNTLAKELKTDFKVEVSAFKLDVRLRSEVTEKLKALPVDILINNAGLSAGLDPIQDGDPDDWDAMIDTNIKGLLYVTKTILPQMVANNSGHIINIGSVAGHTVYPKGAVYCASKYAVHALTIGLRMDLFGTKVRVSSVDPGAVETNFSVVRFKGDTQRAATIYEGFEPLTAEDIADAVLYCATRPPHVNISELHIMPTDQAAASMIARNCKE
jgi:3-hydroxy acid dehydrogenase / malonic semialdehyde reductase